MRGIGSGEPLRSILRRNWGPLIARIPATATVPAFSHRRTRTIAMSKGGANKYAVPLVQKAMPIARARNARSGTSCFSLHRAAKTAAQTRKQASKRSFFAPEACRMALGRVAQNTAATA